MEEKKKRKCRGCGREFYPQSDEKFCTKVCEASARFIREGKKERGPNYTKPKAEEARKYARVMAMFKMPVSERWQIASTFTQEEKAYSLRIQKRMLYDDMRFAKDCEPASDSEREEDGILGESDDGTL